MECSTSCPELSRPPHLPPGSGKAKTSRPVTGGQASVPLDDAMPSTPCDGLADPFVDLDRWGKAQYTAGKLR